MTLTRRCITAHSAILGLVLLVACSGDQKAPDTVAPAAWLPRVAIDSDATVLPVTVFVGSSSCSSFEGVELAETTETITVTARVRSKGGTQSCTDDASTADVDVPLSEPVGGRTLVGCGEWPGFHAPDCDLPWAAP
jgi:hypothetical protein